MSEKRTATRAALRSLTWLLALIFGITGVIGLNVVTGEPKATFVPNLALDLAGGTEVILTPIVEDGKQILPEQLNQAVAIIRQRVDSTGVSEAQINISGENIIVSIPGIPDDSTLDLLKQSAKLEFRAVLVASAGSKTEVGKDGSKPINTSTAKPTSPSDLNQITPALQKEYEDLDCENNPREPGKIDPADKPLVTCSVPNGGPSEKYILGPVEITGVDLEGADAGTVTGAQGVSTNEWAVNLNFNAEGGKKFADVTGRLFPLAEPQNRFAVTIDGYVITAPTTQAVITGGSAQITGSFDQASSKVLADQLKYGSLPISFKVQSQENISATLGSEQLQAGLLAGLIGIILVVIYSVFQYRGLAVITIGSLIVAGILTYILIALLTWRADYRLSLSGIAGLIMGIGITADSFIVYYERVKDELREGKPLYVAVESAWNRAKRTIIVSGAVSLLASVVLYILTVGNVRGFAFTLGLTTLIDLTVVFLFTYPAFRLLTKSKFFMSGNAWTGLQLRDSAAFGYTGRGTFRVAPSVSSGKIAKSSKEAERRQTIAERKASADQNSTAKNKENN